MCVWMYPMSAATFSSSFLAVPVAELVAAVGKPCAYCSEPMDAPTRDHIRPRSKGGTLAPGNRALVCDPCNQDKGSRTLGSWLFRLQKAGDRRAAMVAVLLAAVSAIWPEGTRAQVRACNRELTGQRHLRP